MEDEGRCSPQLGMILQEEGGREGELGNLSAHFSYHKVTRDDQMVLLGANGGQTCSVYEPNNTPIKEDVNTHSLSCAISSLAKEWQLGKDLPLHKYSPMRAQ